MKKAAAVDIGTNSVKMVIGWRDQAEVRFLDIPPVVTRLGQGVSATGRLDAVATERTLDALKRFAALARNEGAEIIRAVGTSALRDAENALEFTERAEDALGGTVEVISGDREARLVYAAARQAAVTIAPDAETVMTTDIGGGSTEIVIGQADTLLYCQSLQLGAVRLTERALPSDPPTDEELRTAADLVDDALVAVPRPEGKFAVIASGGTAANLGAMHIARQSPSLSAEAIFASLHGLSLTYGDILAQIQRLAALALTERRNVSGLEPGRADVIIAGSLIQARILHHVQRDLLFVSVRGLRYGLLHEVLMAL